MARKKMVTRTINTTKVTVMYADVATKSMQTKDILLTGTYRGNKAVLRAIRKYDNDMERIISVENVELLGKKYGMPEEEFLAHAKELTKAEADEAEATENTEDEEAQ